MTQMVVTNLRMAEPEWLQIKAMAGELGMSVNKYLNYLIAKVTTREELGISKETKKVSIWEELPKLAKIKNKPGQLNEDDKIIYA
ncbi:MAG: hypothetical protein U0946_03155 [Patescibacteria group bacterium]|nr:hypothetical protein [Patescibacteria group bacterium]